MKTIKIAPDLDEITVSGNVVSTEFNGMKLEYVMAVPEIAEEDIEPIKECMQAAIGIASKAWQIAWGLGQCIQVDGKPIGRLYVNGELVKEP